MLAKVLDIIGNILNIDVIVNDNEIIVKASKKVKGIIGKMFHFELTTINCNYKGKLIDDKKEIERIV